MTNLNTDYLSELDQCWKRYRDAMEACGKQLRIAQVHSNIAKDKIGEAVYFACDAQDKLNTASNCIKDIRN